MSTPNPVDNPYIYTPKNRATTATRTFHGVLTLLAWALYAYLWLPVLTVLAWVVGIRTAWVELYVRNNHFDDTIFLVILVLAVVATALLVGWAEWNRHKFGGPDRRLTPKDVEADEVARSLAIPDGTAGRLATSKWLHLRMGEDARLMDITSARS